MIGWKPFGWQESSHWQLQNYWYSPICTQVLLGLEATHHPKITDRLALAHPEVHLSLQLLQLALLHPLQNFPLEHPLQFSPRPPPQTRQIYHITRVASLSNLEQRSAFHYDTRSQASSIHSYPLGGSSSCHRLPSLFSQDHSGAARVRATALLNLLLLCCL